MLGHQNVLCLKNLGVSHYHNAFWQNKDCKSARKKLVYLTPDLQKNFEHKIFICLFICLFLLKPVNIIHGNFGVLECLWANNFPMVQFPLSINGGNNSIYWHED